jgi:hypothetical protein
MSLDSLWSTIAPGHEFYPDINWRPLKLRRLLLVLAEGGAPLAITARLENLGASHRHLGLAGGMTAYPKVDPETGELMTFQADWKAPWLGYGVTDANGVQSVDVEIALRCSDTSLLKAIRTAHPCSCRVPLPPLKTMAGCWFVSTAVRRTPAMSSFSTGGIPKAIRSGRCSS